MLQSSASRLKHPPNRRPKACERGGNPGCIRARQQETITATIAGLQTRCESWLPYYRTSRRPFAPRFNLSGHALDPRFFLHVLALASPPFAAPSLTGELRRWAERFPSPCYARLPLPAASLSPYRYRQGGRKERTASTHMCSGLPASHHPSVRPVAGWRSGPAGEFPGPGVIAGDHRPACGAARCRQAGCRWRTDRHLERHATD